MYFYAQLNDENVCFALSKLNGKVDSDKMVLLTEEEFSRDLIGLKYKNGNWINK